MTDSVNESDTTPATLPEELQTLLISARNIGYTRIQIRGDGSGDEGFSELEEAALAAGKSPDRALISDIEGQVDRWAMEEGWNYDNDGGGYEAKFDLDSGEWSLQIWDYYTETANQPRISGVFPRG